MNTFIYYYLSDTSREPIGRVRATSLHNALEQIASIKRLPTNDILELFGIQKIDLNGNYIRFYYSKLFRV